METISRLGMAACAISALAVGCIEGVHGGAVDLSNDAPQHKLPVNERLDNILNEYEERRKKEGSSSSNSNNNHRQLQTRACNEEFSRATTGEITQMIEFFLDLLFGDGSQEKTAAMSVIAPSIRYDIAAIKVCLACNQIDNTDLPDAFLQNGAEYGFPSYCSASSYGYSASHSALVFAPIDPTTGDIFTGFLRGYVHGHATEINVFEAPTDRWPESVSNALATLDEFNKFFDFRNSLTTALAASAGAVSIAPDYIGYGNSQNFDRAYLSQLPYMQAHAVSYLAAKRYISTASNGCSGLDDIATVAGYSEGGYGAVVGALALEKNGVRILSAHAGGTPWDLDMQTGYLLNFLGETAPAEVPSSLDYIPAFFGYGYSNNFPFLSNSGSGNAMIRGPYLGSAGQARNVQNWFGTLNAFGPKSKSELDEVLPDNSKDLFNTNVIQMYMVTKTVFGRLDACEEGDFVTGQTTALCQSLQDNSLVKNGLSDVSFPLTICHSPQDEVVTEEQVPNFGGSVSGYSPEVSLLQPVGDHEASAFVLCSIDPAFALATAATDGADSPILITPLDSPPQRCVAQAPVTPAPVTPSPVTPAPVTPSPVAAPITPAPVTPAPVAPVTPAPVTPAPVTPSPVLATPSPVMTTPAPNTPAPITPAPIDTPAPVATPAPVPATSAPVDVQQPTDAPFDAGPLDCGELLASCMVDDDCCEGSTCVTRMFDSSNNPIRVCSSTFVRTRAKTSVGDSDRGGAAGKARVQIGVGNGGGRIRG